MEVENRRVTLPRQSTSEARIRRASLYALAEDATAALRNSYSARKSRRKFTVRMEVRSRRRKRDDASNQSLLSGYPARFRRDQPCPKRWAQHQSLRLNLLCALIKGPPPIRTPAKSRKRERFPNGFRWRILLTAVYAAVTVVGRAPSASPGTLVRRPVPRRHQATSNPARCSRLRCGVAAAAPAPVNCSATGSQVSLVPTRMAMFPR